MGKRDVCVVSGCSNNRNRPHLVRKRAHVDQVQWHSTSIEERRKVWEKSISKGREGFTFVSRNHKVCSNHFVDGSPTHINPNPTLYLTASDEGEKSPKKRKIEDRHETCSQNNHMVCEEEEGILNEQEEEESVLVEQEQEESILVEQEQEESVLVEQQQEESVLVKQEQEESVLVRQEQEDMAGVSFRRFPQPKTQFDRCMEWIRRCNHPELHVDKISRYHYVCSKHFEDGAKHPVLSTCPVTAKTPKSRKRTLKRAVNSPPDHTYTKYLIADCLNDENPEIGERDMDKLFQNQLKTGQVDSLDELSASNTVKIENEKSLPELTVSFKTISEHTEVIGPIIEISELPKDIENNGSETLQPSQVCNNCAETTKALKDENQKLREYLSNSEMERALLKLEIEKRKQKLIQECQNQQEKVADLSNQILCLLQSLSDKEEVFCVSSMDVSTQRFQIMRTLTELKQNCQSLIETSEDVSETKEPQNNYNSMVTTLPQHISFPKPTVNNLEPYTAEPNITLVNDANTDLALSTSGIENIVKQSTYKVNILQESVDNASCQKQATTIFSNVPELSDTVDVDDNEMVSNVSDNMATKAKGIKGSGSMSVTKKKVPPPSQRPVVCEMCGYIASNLEVFRCHLKLHIDATALQCDICQINFANPTSLKRHKRIHEDGGNKVVCEICGGIYTKITIRGHNLTKHSKGKKPVHVCGCGLTFEGDREYKNHRKKDHPSVAMFPCELCGTLFRQVRGLKKHTLRYHNTVDGAQTSDLSQFSTQKQRNVYKQPLLPCKYCGKLLIKQSLSDHEKSHEGVRYKCEICNKEFIHRSSYLRHKTWCTDYNSVKPFKCDVCPLRFICQGDLDYHFSVHTGEKPFPCQICGKCFRLCGDRNRHEQRHTESNKTPKQNLTEVVNPKE